MLPSQEEEPAMTTPASTFRPATRNDLPEIVRMLADDPLGSQRERFSDPLPDSYYTAFDAISTDANNELIVAENDGAVVGVLQLTFIPYLTFQGSWRALIENVRVSAKVRGQDIGTALLHWAIARAEKRGCRMVQLTTDKSRVDAKRFYEKLGFHATHEGMKLSLSQTKS